jgi:hypothetical protein
MAEKQRYINRAEAEGEDGALLHLAMRLDQTEHPNTNMLHEIMKIWMNKKEVIRC